MEKALTISLIFITDALFVFLCGQEVKNNSGIFSPSLYLSFLLQNELVSG